MESAHLHHHQQFQDHHHQLLPPIFASPPLPNDNNNNIIISNKPSLSSSSPPSCYGVSTTNWTQSNNILSGSRNHQPHHLISICNPPENDDIMSPHGLTFHHWANNNNKHQLSTVEVEEAAAAAAAAQQFYFSTNGDSGGGGGGGGGGRVITSQIYPTINVVHGGTTTSLNNSDNLQALDLFNSDDQSSQDFGFQNFGMDHHHQLQQSNHQRPLFCSNSFPDIAAALSSSCNKNGRPTTTKTSVEPKRQIISNGVEPMPPHAPLIKKSRLDSRASSSPPFQVRKEKLGDRIAALQQLVAPFGKTDTASVLMEAIGYINFLQNQVQTLSFPYMKSSRNHPGNRVIMGGQQHEDNSESEETRMMSLRSRGLCLVPLSCLSYIIPDSGGGTGGGGFWPPHTFGGS